MRSLFRVICPILIGLLLCTEGGFVMNAEAAAGHKRPAMKKSPKKGQKRHHISMIKRLDLSEEWGKTQPQQPEMGDFPLQAEERELSVEGTAYSLIGWKYRFGGTGREGIDCSAFVRKVFSSVNISLPRTAREQFALGKEVPRENLQPGDLLFFATYAPYASHVAIYLGNERMIHASSGVGQVTVSSIKSPYLSSRFIGARRIDTGKEKGLQAILEEIETTEPREKTPEGDSLLSSR